MSAHSEGTGKGSTFSVCLPRLRAEPAPLAPAALGTAKGGTETVLVVDDSEPVLSLTRRIMDRAATWALPLPSGELEVMRRACQPRLRVARSLAGSAAAALPISSRAAATRGSDTLRAKYAKLDAVLMQPVLRRELFTFLRAAWEP